MLRKPHLVLAAASVLAIGAAWAASGFWTFTWPGVSSRSAIVEPALDGTASALPTQSIGPGGLGNWQFLGPNNVGGPTSFVGFRPDSANVAYAVSGMGDVFRSDDSGANWRYLSHVPLRDARLEFVPGQPGVVYAYARRAQLDATGTSGSTLLKSDDAGQTWSPLKPELQHQLGWLDEIDSLRIVPGTPQVIWLASRNGLLRSADDGRHWALVFNAGYSSNCVDLQISSVHAKVYAVCNTPNRNVVAANLDGVGWSILTERSGDEPLVRLAMSRSNEQVLYLASFDEGNSPYTSVRYLRTVSRTSDGGATWQLKYDRAVRTDQVSKAVPGDFETECAAPEFGGLTSDTNVIAVDPANPDKLWVAGFEIYRSDDAGASFGRAVARVEQLNDPALGAAQGMTPYFGFTSLAFPPNYDGTNVQVMFAAGYGGIERSADAGGQAPAAPALSCANRVASGITLQPHNNGYAATRIVHGSSADSGAMVISGPDMDVGLSDGSGPDSWVRLTPLREMVVGQTSLDPVAGVDRFIVGWSSGVVNWSWDATARRWTARQSNFVDHGNPPGYLMSNENIVMRTWFYPRFVRDPVNRLRLVSGTDDGVYESRDGGSFWTLISPNVPVESYGIKRDGSIIAGTADGFLLSQSNPYTQSWQKHDLDGCVLTPGHACTREPLNFTQFVLGPDPADAGMFATAEDFHAAKVWYSADGLHWTALDQPGGPAGLPRAWGTTVLAIDPDNPSHMYAGTPLGLYVSEDRGQTWVVADTPFPMTPVSHLEFRKEASGRRRLVAYTYGRGVWTSDVAASTAFADVPTYAWSYDYVNRLFAAGITSGCSTAPISYCPQQPVLREQMAVFLMRAKHGSAYAPSAPTGMFADVSLQSPYAGWIEQLAQEGITSGCGPSFYCPSQQVSRAQMAVFLLRAKYGSAYQPPAPTGRFGDVATGSPMAPWIEQLAQEGITGGCSATPALFCPDDPVTREQMAVFLVKAFGL